MDKYEPAEDSALLEKHVKNLSHGKVLDIGTGSGIQAFAAKNAKTVTASDIDPNCKASFANSKIKFVQSDLFSNIKGKFDTIIFNPPYLPEDPRVKDITLDGGKKGHELIGRFLSQVNSHLKPEGIILMVISSLTGREKVEKLVAARMLEYAELEKQRIFFEDLHVWLIRKSEALKQLEKKRVTGVGYVARGKRGIVFAGLLGKKKVAIKTANPDSKAMTLENEVRFLKILNKKGIGPKLLFSSKNFLCMEYVTGRPIENYFRESSTRQIKNALKSIVEQLFSMDRLGISKEEMSHPPKHIIIGKKVVLIDFERCHYTEKPSNVPQFCSYLCKESMLQRLNEKKINYTREKLIGAARNYKKSINRQNLICILQVIGI